MAVLLGYTPGIQMVKFPPGIGTVLPANADLLIQVHYAPLPTDETDRSLLNIFYKDADDQISRPLQRLPVSPFNLDDGWLSFSIPPDEVKTFHGTKNVYQDISLISVYPHCHYLGKDWDLFAITSEGDTINIIKIDEWDFNWQGDYTFDRMKKIPEGSVIHVYATYDNTVDNHFNPSNPPQTVSWGEGTTDEMYLVGMTYVPYQDGDEDIIIGEDGTTDVIDFSKEKENKLYPPFPNPVNGQVTLNYYLHKSQTISIELLNTKGQMVETVLTKQMQQAGNHFFKFNVEELVDGNYMVRMNGDGLVLSKPLVIVH